MLQTLIHIPHEILGIPVFGWGWGLGVWALVAIPIIALSIRTHSWRSETIQHFIVFGLLGGAVIFLPHLVATDSSGAPVGLPIRGYGVMMLLGIVTGVGLAMYRARRMGIDPEWIISLAFSMMIAGLLGARLFFVIEFWDQFQRPTLGETLAATLKVTEGGLVVYGSLIGASIAACTFFIRHRLPVLAMADLIAPSLLLGLACGRIGCLLNGCCFGQVCEAPWALRFPRSSSRVDDRLLSPAYEFQSQMGHFHGLQMAAGPDQTDADQPVVTWIAHNSPADQAGFRSGDVINTINGAPVSTNHELYTALAQVNREMTVTLKNGKTATSSLANWPAQSLPVHPTQVYSSIHALLLCLFLCAYYPYRRRDGEVIALCLTLYPIARYLLEIIRADESIAWGLTISQVVSSLLLVAVVLLWIVVLRQPKGSALPRSSA